MVKGMSHSTLDRKNNAIHFTYCADVDTPPVSPP
jgi:hypothetical protein